LGLSRAQKNHKLEDKEQGKRQLLSIYEEDYGALLIKMSEAGWLHDTQK